MLQDCATPLPPVARAIPPEMLNRPSVVHDIGRPIAEEARRGFEGLIASRGRHDNRSTARPALVRTAPISVARRTDTPALQVGVAKSFEQIDAADRLIRKRYAWRGYTLDSFEHESHSDCDTGAGNNITFFAADDQSTLGTITLRLDGPEGLRAEATHRESLQHARRDGRCIGELTRLALAEGVDSRLVLASLFGLVYAVGRWVHDVTEVFIEVNPRHVAFYARALGFAVVGETRFCERVRAPSVLLQADVGALGDRLGLAARDVAEEPMLRYGN